MTPEEKATELFEKFLVHVNGTGSLGEFDHDILRKNAKDCAIIAVDIVLSSGVWIGKELAIKDERFDEQDTEEFWIEVRTKIEEL